MRHLDEDHVHVTVFNSANFFAAGVLAEHTALDRNTLASASATCYGKCVFIQTSDRG